MSLEASDRGNTLSSQSVREGNEKDAQSGGPRRKRRQREERTSVDSARRRSSGGPDVGNPPSTHKKRRSTSKNQPSDTAAPESTFVEEGVPKPVDKPRRQNKRKAGVVNHIGSLEVNLNDFADDVVSSSIESKSEDSMRGTQRKHNMSSQPTGKLFIEQNGGFKTADKEKVARDLWEQESKQRVEDDDDEVLFPVKMTTMNTALQAQHVFKTFTYFLMGILSGLAVAQTVFAYSWTCEGRDYLTLLCSYTNLALPVSCTFYFLLVLCTVAVFDRYDIAKPTEKFLREAATFRSGAVSALLFVAALSVHMCMVPTDDKMSLYQSNRTLWSDVQTSRTDIDTWKILCIAKTALICLAWFIISLRPGTNRLKTNLQLTEVAWVNEAEPSFKLREAKQHRSQRHT